MSHEMNIAQIDRWHLERPKPNRRMRLARSISQYRYLYHDQCERRAWPNTERRPPREPARVGLVLHAMEARLASSPSFRPTAEGLRRELRCNLWRRPR